MEYETRVFKRLLYNNTYISESLNQISEVNRPVYSLYIWVNIVTFGNTYHWYQSIIRLALYRYATMPKLIANNYAFMCCRLAFAFQPITNNVGRLPRFLRVNQVLFQHSMAIFVFINTPFSLKSFFTNFTILCQASQ